MKKNSIFSHNICQKNIVMENCGLYIFMSFIKDFTNKIIYDDKR